MGASISMALGMEKARGKDFARNLVAVIGDSTFIHSGITSLIDVVYNSGTFTTLILDNGTTGMTGRQSHPGTGKNARMEPAPKVSIDDLVRAMGIEPRIVDPFDIQQCETVLKEEMLKEAPSVVITRRECAMLGKRDIPYVVEGCKKCKVCTRIGCPAISFGENGVEIDAAVCNGCGLCAQMCKFDAMKKAEG